MGKTRISDRSEMGFKCENLDGHKGEYYSFNWNYSRDDEDLGRNKISWKSNSHEIGSPEKEIR
jgi:hypothetical protein